MTPKTITVLALAGLLSLPAVATVWAEAPLSADQAVAERQAAMKADGRALRGAADLTGDKAVAALAEVEKNYTRLPDLFVKDSITDKSIALPLIWEQFDKFSAIFAKGADAATKGIAAAKAGDVTGYQEAVKTIGSTCGECHSLYRAKPNG